MNTKIPGRRHRYQRPDTTMTLREGMEEYRAANPGLLEPEAFDNPKLGALMAAHDRCHIVFGTNTDMVQEAMTDLWGMCGTNMGLGYATAFMREPGVKALTKSVMAGLSGWQIVTDFVRSIPYMWKVWVHSRRMRKDWDYFGWEDHLDRPLVELRREFGIELIDLPMIRISANH